MMYNLYIGDPRLLYLSCILLEVISLIILVKVFIKIKKKAKKKLKTISTDHTNTVQRIFKEKNNVIDNMSRYQNMPLPTWNRYHKAQYDFFIDPRWYKRYSNSKKLVHRDVAEKNLGRKLLREEVVHHINRNKTDNRPENLRVFSSQKEHDMLHKWRIINWKLKNLYSRVY